MQGLLENLFKELNEAHFDAFLDLPLLVWNSRLRSAAGRFRPGSRKYWQEVPPRIEIASYLLEEENSQVLVRDTMGHEMIHYWLWVRKKPYGHTAEFYGKMEAMGVSRYNPVPRTRPFRYLYRCLSCLKEFPTRKLLGPLACAQCCKQHAGGRYDSRFKLVLHQKLVKSE
jgi:predicted SprT family Zn-dependent metalloprotease